MLGNALLGHGWQLQNWIRPHRSTDHSGISNVSRWQLERNGELVAETWLVHRASFLLAPLNSESKNMQEQHANSPPSSICQHYIYIYIYRHIHECQKSSIKIHPSSITSRPADLRQSVRSKGPETHSDGVILGLSGAGDLCASSKRVGFFSSVGNGVTSLSSCKTNLLSARGTCVGDV